MTTKRKIPFISGIRTVGTTSNLIYPSSNNLPPLIGVDGKPLQSGQTTPSGQTSSINTPIQIAKHPFI